MRWSNAHLGSSKRNEPTQRPTSETSQQFTGKTNGYRENNEGYQLFKAWQNEKQLLCKMSWCIRRLPPKLLKEFRLFGEDSAAFWGESITSDAIIHSNTCYMGKPLNLTSVIDICNVSIILGPDAIYLQMELFHVPRVIIC